jgi:hypothetical protein
MTSLPLGKHTTVGLVAQQATQIQKYQPPMGQERQDSDSITQETQQLKNGHPLPWRLGGGQGVLLLAARCRLQYWPFGHWSFTKANMAIGLPQ